MVSPGQLQRLGSAPAVQLQRAAAARLPGRVHLPALGRQHPHRGRVDVAEEHPLQAALHERDPAARHRAAVGGVTTASRRTVGAEPAPAGPAGQRPAAGRSARQPRPAAASRRSASSGTSARSRPGWVNSANTARWNSRSPRARRRCAPAAAGPARSAGRTGRPDGQAVTQAMQPRHRSKCCASRARARSPGSWPTRISTIRPRGESISFPNTA